MRSTIPIAKRQEQEKIARDIAEYEAKHGPIKELDSSHNANKMPGSRDFTIASQQAKRARKRSRP